MELRAAARSPLTWILAAVFVLHAIGIGWGLPASDGWDNDGVAPRDFLPGLAATFTPGRFYTYPPVHLAFLAVVTLPITCFAVLRAPSTAVADLVHEMIGGPYMTAISYVARAVSLAMSLGIVLFVARIAEELRAAELGVDPKRMRDEPRVRAAGCFAAVFVGTNAALTYYAHTSNLDVPYLFWSAWALLHLARAVARDEPRRLRRAFAFAALAIGTKDQAYAVFALSVPAVLALWLRSAAPERRRPILREALIAGALAALLLGLVDGAFFNPRGFLARLAFLRGSASQDYVEYTNDWRGRIDVLLDIASRARRHYATPLLLAIPIGLGLSLQRAKGRDGGRRSALALLPALVAISFTLLFNCVARRTDARFTLPQALALSLYGGLVVERLVSPVHPLARIAGRGIAGAALAAGAFLCLSVDVNLLADPRYDAERWLAEHVRPGDTIETYGANVYMPRMPAGARVLRVGPEPLASRNPLPGVEEVQAPFDEAPQRGARYLVVSTAWVWRYQIGDRHFDAGRQLAPTQSRTTADEPAVRFFQRLLRAEGAFSMVHDSRYDDRIFPVVDIHGTTGRWIWIFERKPQPQ